MNCRQPACLASLLAMCAIVAVAANTGAQPAPPSAITAVPTTTVASTRQPNPPTAVTKTASPLTLPDQQVVQKYVAECVGHLVTGLGRTDDAENLAGRARQWLINETNAPPQAVASPEYLLAYATEVNKALLPMAGDPSVRTRLNVGIIAARVAANAKNTALAPVASKLLSDKSPAVVLWGIKAAAGVLPFKGGAVNLAPQILAAVKGLNYSGAVTEEAYRAMDDSYNVGKNGNAIDTVLSILAARVAMYDVTKMEYPDDPGAERAALTALTAGGSGMWAGLNAQQRTQVLQLMADVMDRSATLLVNKADLSPDARDQFLSLVKTTCGCAFAVAPAGHPLQTSAAQGAKAITVGGATPSSPASVRALVDAVLSDYAKAFNVKPSAGPAAAAAGAPQP